MRKPASLVIFAAITALLPIGVQARSTGQALVMIPMFSQQPALLQPANWALAFQYQDARSATVKFLPSGQDLGGWREMIALQAFKGLAAHTEYGPEIMLRAIRNELAPHCPAGLVAFPLDTMSISGHSASAMLLGCPEADDDFGDFLPGQGEMALYISIKGSEDFYVFRHAIRGARFNPATPPINPENFLDYTERTAPVLLCEKSDNLPACLARSRATSG